MRKFLYLYRGPATPVEDFTPEQSAEQGRALNDWMARVGPALVEVGSPFGACSAVADDGSSREPSDQNGYTIVEADDLDAARGLVKDHPSWPRARAGSASRSSNSYRYRRRTYCGRRLEGIRVGANALTVSYHLLGRHASQARLWSEPGR